MPESRSGPPPDATLLIVAEDDRVASLLHPLAHAGYQTLRARSSEEGMRLARFDLPDLIYWDTALSAGADVAPWHRLRSDSRTGLIPVIAVGANGSAESRVRGLHLGADDCVSGSVPAEELLARTRAQLRRKRAGEAVLRRQQDKLEQIRAAQTALLPTPESCPEGRFGISFVPVLEAGGDYYDVLPLDEHMTAYFVADVSGHDLAASFASPALKTALHLNTWAGSEPRRVLADVNRALRTLFRDDKFVTACLAVVDRRRQTVAVANAGHPRPFVLGRDGRVRVMETEGDILGVFPDAVFDQVTVPVLPGERLFLYTDGVTEALGGDRRCATTGFAELLEICGRVREVPIRVAVPEVTVQAFGTGRELRDDFVLLGVEI